MEQPVADGAAGSLPDLATLPPIERVTCRAILQSLPHAVVVLDAEWRIVFGNAHATQMFGVGTAQLRGQPITVLIPDPRFAVWLTEFGTPRRTVVESSIPGATPELPARTLNIEAAPLPLTAAPQDGAIATRPAEDAHLLVIEDISNRVMLERRLIDSEKRAIAGEVAAGILTDAAEPITVLGAKLTFIRTALDAMEPEDVKQALDSAFDQIDRLRVLLGRMAGVAESGLTQSAALRS